MSGSSVKTVGIRITGDASGLRVAVSGAGSDLEGLSGKARGAGDSLDRFDGRARNASTGADRLSAAIGRVAHYGLAGGAMVGLVRTVGAAGEALFTASVRAQNLRTQLDFSSGGKGAQELAFVTGLADKLGLELNSTATAYAGFASAARGTALEGAGAQAVFTAVAKASAVMGLSADQSSGALLAVQQMLSKGVVSAEEFRGQLGERMPIAAQAGARALGVTQAEFAKMLETGQIVAQDFLPKFARAMEEMLGDSAEAAAKRLDGSTQRMGNSWAKLKTTVGDAGASETIATGMNAASHDMNAFSEAMESAKARGSGFFGQINQGLGVMIGRAVGLNYISTAFQSNAERAAYLAVEIPKATARLEELKASGADTSPNIYIRSSYFDLVRYIAGLKDAQREQAALAGKNIGGGRGSVNPLTVGAMDDTATAAMAAFDKTVAGAKTAAAAQKEYTDRVAAAKKALDALASTQGVSDADLDKRRKAFDQSEKAWAAERDSKLKEISANAVSAAKRANEAEAEQITQGYRIKELRTADGLEALASLRRQGFISEADMIRQSTALRLADVDAERESVEKKLALARRRSESEKEQAALRSQLEVLGQKRTNVGNRGDRELQELYAKPMLEQVRAQEQATQSTWQAAEAQERQNLVLGKGKAAIQDLIVAELERQRSDLQGTDNVIPGYLDALDKRIAAEKRLTVALREQEGRELVMKNSEKEQEEARRSAESVSNTFRDGFARMFMRDSNFLSTIGKSLKTTIATAVADAFYAATIKSSVESFTLWLRAQLTAALSTSGSGSMIGSILSFGASLLGMGASSSTYSLTSGTSSGLGLTAGGGGLGLSSGGGLGIKLPSAKGNAFGATAGISAYRNTVIDRPTLFPFAKGVGLVGEAAGAPGEAIMPLTRTRDGRLGVASTGGGSEQAGLGGLVFSPTFHVDRRADRAQVIADMQEVAQQQNLQLIEQLKRAKLLPQG